MTERNGDLFRDISALAEASLRGELSPEEAERLERLVLGDAEARRIYVRYMHESHSLHTWAAHVPGAEPVLPPEDRLEIAPAKDQPARATARRTSSATSRISRIVQRSARPRSPNPLIMPVAVAAAFLLGLGLALVIPTEGRRDPREESGVTMSPAPRADSVPAAEPVRPPVVRPKTPVVPKAEAHPTGEKGRTPPFHALPAVFPPDRDPREIEREMREAIDRSRAKRGLPPRRDGSPERATSVAIDRGIARIEGLSGRVSVIHDSRRSPAVEGLSLLAGTGIEVAVPDGRATLAYPDGTRITLAPGTVISGIALKKGKQVVLKTGRLEADVARQPAGRPLRLRTPQAEATVLGTTLRLSVEKNATLLMVSEGRVRLSRPGQRGSVEVTTGHQAVATAEGGMWSGPSPLKEIVLLAHQAHLVGTRWRRVQDQTAIGGKALDAPRVLEMFEGLDVLNRGKDYAEFVFPADAGVTYNVWIRGRCLAVERPIKRDAVALLPLEAAFVRNAAPYGAGSMFNGYSNEKGFWWIGGNADSRRTGTPADLVPVAVRFNRSGLQRIRLVPAESPVRIDAIWLSVTRSTRPDPEQKGPK